MLFMPLRASLKPCRNISLPWCQWGACLVKRPSIDLWLALCVFGNINHKVALHLCSFLWDHADCQHAGLHLLWAISKGKDKKWLRESYSHPSFVKVELLVSIKCTFVPQFLIVSDDFHAWASRPHVCWTLKTSLLLQVWVVRVRRALCWENLVLLLGFGALLGQRRTKLSVPAFLTGILKLKIQTTPWVLQLMWEDLQYPSREVWEDTPGLACPGQTGIL